MAEAERLLLADRDDLAIAAARRRQAGRGSCRPFPSSARARTPCRNNRSSAGFAAPGDEDHLLDPRLARFVDRILDQRPVDDRQHLLGHRLGRRQQPGAEPGDREHRLADALAHCGFTGPGALASSSSSSASSASTGTAGAPPLGRRQVEAVADARRGAAHQLVDPVGARISGQGQQLLGVGVVRAISGLTGSGWPGAGLRSPMLPQAPSRSAAAAMIAGRIIGEGLAALGARFQPPCRGRRRLLTRAAMGSPMLPMLCAAALLLAGCDRAGCTPDERACRRRASTEAMPASPRPTSKSAIPTTSLRALPMRRASRCWSTSGRPGARRASRNCRPSTRSAAAPGSPRVIAVSQDMAPRASVEAFLDRLALGELEAWHDPEMRLSGALGARPAADHHLL